MSLAKQIYNFDDLEKLVSKKKSPANSGWLYMAGINSNKTELKLFTDDSDHLYEVEEQLY